MRSRMLLGLWDKDLERRLEKYLDPQRRAAWGAPDLSSNVFKSITTQLACLFDRVPTVEHQDPRAELLISPAGALTSAGLWPKMAHFQAKCLGLREYALRIGYDSRFGLQFRLVAPHEMVAHALPEDPETPVVVEELRLREHPERGTSWYWDCLDVSDPQNPIFKICEAHSDGKKGADFTFDFTGKTTLSGDAYPYRRADGSPVLPYVLFHAESTGKLWDAYTWREVVEGSLSSALLMSFFTHAARQASWPQRWAVGVRVPGAEILDMEGAGRRARVPVDPTSLLLFENDSEGQPMIGQFQPGADISVMLESIIQYEHRVASWCGISAASLQREQAGTARSGYALSLTNAGKRESQRKYTAQFRAGMLSVIEKSAAILNSAEGFELPEKGYSIRFESIPKTPDETKAEHEKALALIEAGLMDKVSAYQALNPGVTREGAMMALDEIRRLNAQYSGIT